MAYGAILKFRVGLEWLAADEKTAEILSVFVLPRHHW